MVPKGSRRGEDGGRVLALMGSLMAGRRCEVRSLKAGASGLGSRVKRL